MKGGKKKLETVVSTAPVAAAEEGDGAEEGSAVAGEEEEKEEEEEEGEEEGLGEEELLGVGEGPKLEDGFYEIEDIRKKRVRKGQIQYLIKW